MAKLEALRKHQDAEFAGRWIKLEILPGQIMKVKAAFGAKPEFQKAFKARQEKFRMEHGIRADKELSAAQSDECFFGAAFGRTILDWDDFEDDSGPIEFTEQNLLSFVLPHKPTYLYRMRRMLLDSITMANNQETELVEVVEGNLPSAPSGAAGGLASRTLTDEPSSTE